MSITLRLKNIPKVMIATEKKILKAPFANALKVEKRHNQIIGNTPERMKTLEGPTLYNVKGTNDAKILKKKKKMQSSDGYMYTK